MLWDRQWRSEHRGWFYVHCLLAGLNIGWLVALLPTWWAVGIAAGFFAATVVFTVRMARHARQVQRVFGRLRSAIEQEDHDQIEAAALDLALLLPSAKRRRRFPDSFR